MRVITKEQFKELSGKLYAPDSRFAPVLDADGDRVISEEEVDQCAAEEFQWVKKLPYKEWKRVEINKE